MEASESDRLGAENDGWAVARTTLSAERGIYVLPVVNRLHEEALAMVDAVHQLRPEQASDYRQMSSRHYANVAVLRQLVNRVLHDAMQGRVGPEASLLKLYYSEIAQELTRDALEVSGLAAQIPWKDAFEVNASTFDGNWARSHYSSWAWTIGGGTSEIQRNVIAERALGLPREPRPPMELP